MTDILDDSYESDLTDEEHERLILISEHAIAPPRSPAAQAVLDAYRDADIDDAVTAAAVLRAAVDQILPELPEPSWWRPVRPALRRRLIRKAFLSIADELESQ